MDATNATAIARNNMSFLPYKIDNLSNQQYYSMSRQGKHLNLLKCN